MAISKNDHLEVCVCVCTIYYISYHILYVHIICGTLCTYVYSVYNQ